MKKLLILGSIVLALTACGGSSDSSGSSDLGGSSSINCSSITMKHCSQMSSCGEAKQQLICGNDHIDGDYDGVPCEKQLCR